MPSEPGLPRVLGRYALHEELGRGGMGVVYGGTLLGRGGFEKPVALKVLKPGHTGEPLLEEARLGGLLHHPYIVETYDVGVLDGRVYLAMEWVKGPTLKQVLASPAALPIGLTVTIALQLAVALDHAHGLQVGGRDLGLVHLDVKPQNILLDPLGFTKLTDFGIARARGFRIQEQGPVGTRGYMAPELIAGEEVDARADVFALGTVLAEMALRRRLWPSESWPAYIEAVAGPVRHLREQGLDVALDAVLPGLSEVVSEAVRADQRLRFASARGLSDALRSLHPGSGSVSALVAETLGRQPPRNVVDGGPLGTAARTNLATAHVDLVGREDEAASLRSQLATPGLVTLIGPGGMGKTALACAVGARCTHEFAGGVWFVDLVAATSLGDVVQAARAVLKPDLPGDDLVAQLEAIAADLAGRGRTLLILDNFEQLADMAAQTAGHWLARAPGLTVLVTSQRRLGLAEERLVPLGGLTVAAGVDLFRRRAAALVADGGGSAATGRRALGSDEDLVAIARALDGLPLAIELAASRIRILSPAAIHAGLAQGLRLLVDRGSGRPARHRTLERTVAWSWSLLAPWQQEALRQLSVFRGPFTVEKAQEVLDLTAWPEAPWPMFVLEDLLDRSLIALVPGDAPRFRLLLAIRSFAEARLGEAPGSGDVVARHGQVFSIYGSRDHIMARYGPRADEAQDELVRDAPDVRWALDRALERNDWSVAYHTCRAWCDIQQAVGTPHAQIEVVQAVLGLPGIEGQYRLGMLHQLAVASLLLGDFPRQEAALAEGGLLAEEIDNALWIGVFASTSAAVCGRNGDFAGAQAGYRRALEAAHRGNDRLNATIYQANLAVALRQEGRLHDALVALEEARELAELRGHRRVWPHILHHLGYTRMHLGQLDAARELLESALPLNIEGHQSPFVIEGHLALSRLDGLCGDWTGAMARGKLAIQEAEQRQDVERTAWALAWVALDRVESDPLGAAHLARRATALAEGLSQPMPSVVVAAAAVAYVEGRVSTALALADLAVGQCGAKELYERSRTVLWRARIRCGAGDREGARIDRAVGADQIATMGVGPEGWLRRLLATVDAELGV